MLTEEEDFENKCVPAEACQSIKEVTGREGTTSAGALAIVVSEAAEDYRWIECGDVLCEPVEESTETDVYYCNRCLELGLGLICRKFIQADDNEAFYDQAAE